MMNIAGKKILILVTGGIAAYKINTLVRDFIKSNAEVQVVLTPDAEKFVTTLTLSTLSKNPVFSTFYSDNGEWNSHVELALWADAILVAPCTANTLAKISHGLCDNLVMAVYLSAKCPVFIAPAMDLDMYQHPTTKKNLETISGFGNYIIPAESGELASGLVGEGRMAEPETIFATLNDFFQEKKSGLKDKKILITAGPTYEAIDPVRFIGNHSSGKMGLALAAESCKRGAQVIVILGPTSLHYQHPNLQIIRVTSAKEMMTKVLENYDNAEIAIASAAVADYAPKIVATEKIKKKEDSFTLELVKNPDILKTMGERKTKQILVGFALETQNEEENAQKKLSSKNLDFIVLNSLNDEGAGFQKDTNKIKIISKSSSKEFNLKTKTEVAIDILNEIELLIKKE